MTPITKLSLISQECLIKGRFICSLDLLGNTAHSQNFGKFPTTNIDILGICGLQLENILPGRSIGSVLVLTVKNRGLLGCHAKVR